MSALFDISILVDVIRDVHNRIDTKNERTIEAIRLMRKAFIHTYDYLKNKDGGYIPKTDLAELWNDAASAVMKVDRHLGDLLAGKSRFWTHPEIYIELGREKEVPDLKRIIDEMERLRLKLK